MTAFVPIPAREAAEMVEAAGIPDARRVLIDSAAAGLVKAYALAIETFDTKGECATVNRALIPRSLLRRMASASEVDNIWSGAAIRLPGSELIGGTPTVHVTGVGFGQPSLQALIADHGRRPAVASASNAKAPPTDDARPDEPMPVDAKIEPIPSSQPVRKGPNPAAIPVGAITVTVKVAMAATGLGRTTIDKLMGEGRLERVKVGGRTLITVASIRSLLGQGATRLA